MFALILLNLTDSVYVNKYYWMATRIATLQRRVKRKYLKSKRLSKPLAKAR